MQNKDKWVQRSFLKDKRGRIIGTHMHRIIGPVYEKVIREHARGSLADIGCGEVPYYFIYKDLIDDNICIDWKVLGSKTSYLDHTVNLNHENLPLQPNSVDTVLCTDVLEHIKHPEHLFSEMARILKVGGKLILTVPFMYWLHDTPNDYHRYSKYKLKDFCEINGLVVHSISEYGGLPEIVYDVVWKGFTYYPLPFKKIFLVVWKTAGRVLSRFATFKKISFTTKEEFPLGYILVAQKKKA